MVVACFLIAGTVEAQTEDKPLTEDDFYPILRFDLPKEEVLEGGGLEVLPRIRQSNGKAELFVPLRFQDGRARVEMEIPW